MPLAIAAPAFAIAAIFAILFLLGYQVFAPMIVRALSIDLPYVGNITGRLVSEGLDAVYLASTAFLDNLVLPAINMVLGPLAVLENNFFAVKNALDQYAAAIATIAQATLPQALASVIGLSADELNTLENYVSTVILGKILGLESYVQGAVNDVESLFSSELNDVRQQVASVLAATATAAIDANQIAGIAASAAGTVVRAAEVDISNHIQVAYADATGYTDSRIAAVENEISQDLARIDTLTANLVATTVGVLTTDIDQAISGAVSGVVTDVDGAIADVIGILGTDDADILSAIKAIDLTNIASIAGVSALSISTTLTLARYLRDCGIPNCKNLSELGQELQNLLSVIEDASFLEFLLSLIHNPRDAATTLEDTFGSMISSGVSLVESVLQVA